MCSSQRMLVPVSPLLLFIALRLLPRPPSGFAPSLEDVLRDLRHARASLDVAMTNGPASRCALASLAITSRLAPTASASSTLLITSKSACVTPGPPFRGILSPPHTSMTYTMKSASSTEVGGEVVPPTRGGSAPARAPP